MYVNQGNKIMQPTYLFISDIWVERKNGSFRGNIFGEILSYFERAVRESEIIEH